MAIHVSIEGYDSLEQIGIGGMAAVYRARKMSIDKVVAIKVLFPYLASDESFIDRFQREAKAAARIQHENVVNVIDYGESDGSYYIVMEYYEGQTLEDIVKEHGALPLDIAVLIMLEVCYGLESAHAKGIVHRDIKPSNLIYTSQGGVKIADFGLAKQSDSMTMITQQGKVMGTPAYMSPEQAAGRNVTTQSDVFSLGVVAYELLADTKPFGGTSFSEVLEKIQTHEPPSVANINPLIQPDFENIVSRMLEKDLSKRYEDMRNVINDVEAGMEKFHMTRDRRRLTSYVKDPEAYEKVFKEKMVARCLSQGTYYLQQGQSHLEDAILEFRRILHIDPGNDRAQKNLDKIMAERGRKGHTVAIEAQPSRASRTGKEAKAAKQGIKVVAGSAGRKRAKVGRRLAWGVPLAAGLVLAGYFGMLKFPVMFPGGGANAEPMLSAPSRMTVSAGEKISFSLKAFDPDGDAIRFYAEGLPSGAGLTTGGEFSWSVDYSQAGSYQIKFYADDGHSASLSETIIEVQKVDVLVNFQQLESVRVQAGREVRRALRATSSTGNPVNYTLENGPEGMRVEDDQLIWKPVADIRGTFRARVRAGDGYATETQTVAFSVWAKDASVAERPAASARTGRVEWSLPVVADIYVNGKLEAKRDRKLSMELPTGQHTLKASLMDGVTGWEQVIKVAGGQNLTLTAPELKYGKLSVYFLGGVGELRVDGKPFKQQPPFTGARVPVGRHVVSCRMRNETEPREVAITVRNDEETVVEYEFGSEPVVMQSD